MASSESRLELLLGAWRRAERERGRLKRGGLDDKDSFLPSCLYSGVGISLPSFVPRGSRGPQRKVDCGRQIEWDQVGERLVRPLMC